MFQAFLLGFWAIWSYDRDVHAISESLTFMIIAVLISMGVNFAMPMINGEWALIMAILWMYVAGVLTVVNRYSNSFVTTMLIACISAVGFYQLSERLPGWVASWIV
ncbi:hypothetical protein [Neisseria sp. 74A18]|uniref:hypothetical protein n=1 Tax=Neisseria sp. 74A18 TaxID=1696094 RepID=UPI0006CAEC7B|nr:hypothetical protein [Neisseria sp. 74A18]KPN74205.1 hypothetical protein AKG43_03845 [Neisseria sp. 74A18]